MTMELNKYFKSESVEIRRSEINFASYNPRVLSDEEKKTIKRGIKKFGLVGGLIVNKQTGMTVVGGHQRISILDELNKYPENDYLIRVDLIDMDEKSEKELNILLNNPNAQGKWDFDALREIIPDISYKDAGLTEDDLSLIGVDFLFQTEEENNLTEALEEMMQPSVEQKQAEKEAKTAHMKEVKAQVKAQAESKAQEMDAYIMLSFDSFNAKAAFMRRFGYDIQEKFIKGEVFSDQVERID